MITSNETSYIGKSVDRVDGVAKVTGTATYAGEVSEVGITYGVVVSSAVARGRITRIDTNRALALEGVLQVFSHENAPDLPWLDFMYKDMDSPPGKPFRPFYSNEIQFAMQPVALVVAERFELARYAASLVKIEYETSRFYTSVRDNLDKGYEPKSGKPGYKKPKSRGNAEKAFARSEVKVHCEYFHGAEHHNPMEMHASTVLYDEDGQLIVFDKTQGVINSHSYITRVFGIPGKSVRVLSPFVGGAFGSGLRPQYQLFMAVLAALELKRSVKVMLTRQQMFSFGHRPASLQKLSLGAARDGKLKAIIHEAFCETSQFEAYTEIVVNWSGMLYACDNVSFQYKLVPLDVSTPLDMRAPGAATGILALECAVEELAFKLHMDPLEFRLKNYTETEQITGKPFSSKALRDCYIQGAEHFGWEKRKFEPRSMRDGDLLIGWGMASGIWDAMQMPARAKAVLSVDGRLTVSSATADIGTGTYTIMTQIAAEMLGLPMENVTFKLGDSALPLAPYEGGSATAASVGTAVKKACDEICKKVFKLAQQIKDSPLSDADISDIIFSEGAVRLKHDPAKAVTIKEALRHGNVNYLEETVTSIPDKIRQSPYALHSHAAVFVEVKVDEALGTIKVTRVVSAIAGGRVLNPKTARSQILGGVVWGISMALHEDTVMDHHLGRFMNHDLAEYHIPVQSDIHDIEVIFVEEKDEVVNPLGVKGLGEIGVVGVAAAVANAIFHATGKRVRDFPITPDKLL